MKKKIELLNNARKFFIVLDVFIIIIAKILTFLLCHFAVKVLKKSLKCVI